MTSAPPQIEDVLALSPLQEGLFSLSRLSGDGIDLYTMQFVADIDGPLDVGLLRRSAEAMLVRHPNLRAAFWDRDVPRPVQIVPTHVELPWTERIAVPGEFDAIAESERRRPFDLSRGPALRIVLLTVPGAETRRMILTAHHILMDGWAVAVFFTELLAVYRAGGSLDCLPKPRPYRDYIGWLVAQDAAAATAKWAEYLGGLSGPLMLADGAAAGRTTVPEKTKLRLPATETTQLQQWARRNGLTLNTAVQFAWTVVLARLTDRRDVVFGTTISGRPDQLSGVEGMVGLFINTVPVVHHLDHTASVLEQCARLQRESAAMRDIGYLSLSHLQRVAGHGPLFDTLFVFENAPINEAIQEFTAPDGTCFRPIEMESLAHYPLTVVAHLDDSDLVVLIEAIPEALPHFPAAEIGERLLTVLRQLPSVADDTADALNILNPAEHAEYRAVAAQADAAAEPTVWELFECQARATPDALALTTGAGQRYTYAELHDAASRLAWELGEHGVGPEAVAALVLPRSAQSIVAILAVLAAGGAYVPVDISLPSARIESILRQAQPVVAVTVGACREMAGPGLSTLVLDDPVVAERVSSRPAVAPQIPRHQEHRAYLIFTSGSTGEPKGVIGTNAAMAAYFADHRDRVYRPAMARLGRPLRIAHAWSLSFDASWQPMVGLLAGQALHLFDAEEMRDAHRLVEGMLAHGIDMIDTTPSMFAQLAAAGLLERGLPVLALGGEAIDTALWSRLRALPGTVVYNCYGPTETTVEAVVAPVEAYATPTIGTPNRGTSAYVLDSRLRPVPNGAVGELYLSGAQLARGYAGKAAVTADRFVADPLRPGLRMYRTGDLVRRLPHGGFAYLGRADAQVKIRGYRIEIGEIETALRRLPGVTTAAVTVVRRAGGASLVGFVVRQQNRDGDVVRLRAQLAERLPAYMVPARIVALAKLPVNANGKLDGRALAQLAEQALSGGAPGAVRAAASTDTERAVAEVFAELFDGKVPGIDDDFFALGVDSIVAISLVNKARRRGIAVSPRMVLSTPTIRDLAAAIDAAAGAGPSLPGADYGEVLPLPVVSWMYEYGNYRRFTQTALLRLPAGVDRAAIESVLQALLDGHDTLRALLRDTPEGPRLVTREPGVVHATDLLTAVRLAEDTDAGWDSAIADASRAVLDQIDPRTGDMVRAVWFTGVPDREMLLLTVHHLAVDVVSWHIMLGGMTEAWRAIESGAAPKTLPEFTSYRRWSKLMWERAATPEVLAQRDYWAEQVRDPEPALGHRHPDPASDTWSTLRVTSAVTPVPMTERILAALTREEGVREFLLAALTMTIASWRRDRGQDPSSGALIALEGHGRADATLDTDTTNTLGWFTSVFPVRLGAGPAAVEIGRAEADPAAARSLLDSVKAHLGAIPQQGLDYGLLRYVSRVPELQTAAEPQVEFNYLGRVDLSGAVDQPWSLLTGPRNDALPLDPEPDLPLRYALDVIAGIGSTPDGPQLTTNWRWSEALFSEADADRLTRLWQRSIAALAATTEH
ncbi:amino acid adenylation domain-containing protein [Nocardia amamiensis]|uniref:Amino acid adenylation domain-containing protein n=1 Tax=Nocardia amamiensis TaxID=404578 RepID=A0ABS0CM87_9NOCA|nr:non-ribosomal peptide synthetase [Nocardia amamiensis]MBF6297697.1 amino acid adenylation domain-containing protein [Nocardia amamiensis]